MKQSIFEIVENRPLNASMYEMKLARDTSDITSPGQFVNIKLDGFYLRRPISVCDSVEGVLTILYKTVGKGTNVMAGMKIGEKLDILTGLGNGYDTSVSGEKPLLIGGGAGLPPMYMLAKKLIGEGKRVTVIAGFNTKSELYYIEQFEEIGAEVIVTTVDGSAGTKGFVTNAMPAVEGYSYVYTCGPEPMLKAVYNASNTSGQYSFEERMGCGFGACMGCSCETKYGAKRICRDGPVLVKEEIIW